jgi:hypothetical protein
MVTNFSRVLPHLKRTFRRNGADVIYKPPRIGETVNSFGETVGGLELAGQTVRAAIDMTPNPQEVTAYGDSSAFRTGTLALIRVLAEDCQPSANGSFYIPQVNQTFDVIYVKPLIRGEGVIRFDCLVGRHL